MSEKGIKNPRALAKLSGASEPCLYLFLGGKTKSLAVSTRRKLAAVFPESCRLFVADIIGPEAA
jgi:hypothetical protein